MTGKQKEKPSPVSDYPPEEAMRRLGEATKRILQVPKTKTAKPKKALRKRG